MKKEDMKENTGRRLARENRKIRWAGTKVSTRSFISTLFLVLFLTAIIALFSWGIAALFAALR